jgi:hypothetical protein
VVHDGVTGFLAFSHGGHLKRTVVLFQAGPRA